MLIFSALGMSPFRSIKLRKKKPSCPACGVEGQKIGQLRDEDYIQFCGGPRPDWVSRGLLKGSEEHRVSARVRRIQIELLALVAREGLKAPDRISVQQKVRGM